MQPQVGLHQCVGLGDRHRKAALSTWLQRKGVQPQVERHLYVHGTCKAGQPCQAWLHLCEWLHQGAPPSNSARASSADIKAGCGCKCSWSWRVASEGRLQP